MTIFIGNDRLIREVSMSALNPIGIVGMYTHFIADSTRRIAACKLMGVPLRDNPEGHHIEVILSSIVTDLMYTQVIPDNTNRIAACKLRCDPQS